MGPNYMIGTSDTLGPSYKTDADDTMGPSFKTEASDTESHKTLAGDTLVSTYNTRSFLVFLSPTSQMLL
jgi:hypothetical protein